MRYVVKNKETGCFLKHSGEWTRYLSQAQLFPNGLSVNLHLEGSPSLEAREELEVVRLPLS